MAQKRMFDKSITNSDDFLDLPDSSQVLYFHLSMNADDDGFVNNWKSILRMTGTKEDDLKILVAKQFVIPFDSGVIVIKHWRINNYLRNDRYKETKYKEELASLTTGKNEEYLLKNNNGIPLVYPDKNRIDKNRIDKNSLLITTTTKDIYKYIEENFGRTLSSIETEKIDEWLLSFENEIVKYAIQIATLNNKRTFNYVNGILKNWKTAGYKTLQEIKDNEVDKEMTEKENKELEEIIDYNWIEDSEV